MRVLSKVLDIPGKRLQLGVTNVFAFLFRNRFQTANVNGFLCKAKYHRHIYYECRILVITVLIDRLSTDRKNDIPCNGSQRVFLPFGTE